MNAANFLTLLRIVLIPFVAMCFFYKFNWWRETAWFIFTVASVSDYFDGWLARQRKTITLFGTVLDPIADKLLLLSCLFLLVWNGDMSGVDTFLALILIWREMLISGLREGLRNQNVSIPVSWMSKWKTFLQLIAIAGFILGDAYHVLFAARVVFFISVILSLITAFRYVFEVHSQLHTAKNV